MKNKLKILHITTGIMEIPPKNWGAVEKVIWNYKINFEKLGHEFDIGLPWDFKKDYDIIHCHVYNQCVYDLHKVANKKYIFSLHDHHVVPYGKKSNLYKDNLEAMKKSIISITHAEYLIDYFDSTDKLFYLSHGVDSNKYINKNRFDLSWIHENKNQHRLLCVAANGLISDPYHDRKGFRLSIESAISLNLPITIVGPKKNKDFFEKNIDLLDYEKLQIIYDPDEDKLIDIYNDHTIFLHLSDLEAGHPNLTILESLSCGLPVVGTYNGNDKIDGLINTDLSLKNVVKNIKYTIDNYDELKKKSLESAKKYDWSNITSKLEQIYYNVIDINEKFDSDKVTDRIIDVYNNTEILSREPLKPKINIGFDFKNGARIDINCIDKDVKYKIDFIDKSNNVVVYSTNLSPGYWSSPNRKWFTKWLIKITNIKTNEIIHIEFDLENKDVYINMDGDINDVYEWIKDVERFRKINNCIIHCFTKYGNELKETYKDINFVDEYFNINNVYAKYDILYTDDRNINPNGNTGKDISKDVLGL